jgi:hypothetical protein
MDRRVELLGRVREAAEALAALANGGTNNRQHSEGLSAATAKEVQSVEEPAGQATVRFPSSE